MIDNRSVKFFCTIDDTISLTTSMKQFKNISCIVTVVAFTFRPNDVNYRESRRYYFRMLNERREIHLRYVKYACLYFSKTIPLISLSVKMMSY